MAELRALFDALLETTEDAACIVDGTGLLTHWNRAFVNLSRATGRDVPRVGGALGEPLLDVYRRTIAGRIVSSETPMIVDGLQRMFMISGRPVEGGGAVVMARDVTGSTRRAREDFFELSLTRLFIERDRPLAETLADALEYICTSDDWDGGMVWIADELGNMLEPLATYGEPPVHQDIAVRAWKENDVVWQFEQRAVAVPVRDGTQIIGVLELFTDAPRPIGELRARALMRTAGGLGRLTARRRVEDERRRLLHVIERKGLEWSSTFDAIELPIFITSMDGAVRRMNRAGLTLAGRPDYGDLLGRRIGRLAPEEPWTTLGATVEAMRDSGQPCAGHAYHPESDRTWDIAGNTFRSDDGTERAILIARETTALVRLQSSVRRGEQLAALGELVAGVAHEVRNPIFGIQITVDTLEAALPKDNAEIAELVVLLRRWLDRLNRLMESLLAYGRTWTVDLRSGSVEQVIANAVEGCQPIANAEKVAIETRIEPTLPILMDASRLVQAFENLITNAVQHSPEGSSIVVTSRTDDGFVEFAVRDPGPGFSATDLPRIFEPFFTKRRGGTGLGLAIVQRIVDEHGGTVHAENADEGGAVITVRLPVYIDPTTPP